MKAVILVGGGGTRLRPLTCNTPKPMIPLVNQPFIEHVLETLRDQGIEEVILAVQYLADRFRQSLGDGSRLGLKVHIVEEPEPRGTAGAGKNIEHMLDGTTFVFNGDVMTDLDLQAMLAFHRERNSKLTIALTPVEDPTAFGLVETEEDGRVRRFLEKPNRDEVTTNMINAGTYILEPEVFRYVPKHLRLQDIGAGVDHIGGHFVTVRLFEEAPNPSIFLGLDQAKRSRVFHRRQ